MNTEPNDKLSNDTDAGQLRQAVVVPSAFSRRSEAIRHGEVMKKMLEKIVMSADRTDMPRDWMYLAEAQKECAGIALSAFKAMLITIGDDTSDGDDL